MNEVLLEVHKLGWASSKVGHILLLASILQTWAEGCLQIFFSLGPAWGGIITMSSYNRFNHNCLRDAMLLPVINCGTSFFAGLVIFSIIGFMANDAGLPVKDVIQSGPGLVFVAYPEAISRMPIPQFWSVLFFVMLINIGLGTQFGMVQTVISGIQDRHPRLAGRWRPAVTTGVCLLFFLMGIPMVTGAGIYIFQILDWYAALFSVTFVALLECVVFSWVYGWPRLSGNIEAMLGRPPHRIWMVLWCYITPLMMVGVLVYTCCNLGVPTYGDYTFPSWSIALGWLITFVSLVPLPVMAVQQILSVKGTLWQRLCISVQPTDEWGPALEKHKVVEAEMCIKL